MITLTEHSVTEADPEQLALDALTLARAGDFEKLHAVFVTTDGQEALKEELTKIFLRHPDVFQDIQSCLRAAGRLD